MLWKYQVCCLAVSAVVVLTIFYLQAGSKLLTEVKYDSRIVTETELAELVPREDPSRCPDIKESDFSSNSTKWGNHRLAVLVPYRGAFEELLVFAPYLHKFLNERRVRHDIMVIHQVDTFRFNKGSLINIGYLMSRDNFDYLAIHDIDILPVNPHLNYSYPEKGPYHMSSPEYHPQYHGTRFVGGILLLTHEQFKKSRGMTNGYWGWGAEDNEFYSRMKNAKLEIHRPTGLTTGLKTFRNLHDDKKRVRDKTRFNEEGKNVFKIDRQTGFHNVKYKLMNKMQLTIDEAPISLYNVELKCDKYATPWCDPNYKGNNSYRNLTEPSI